MNQHPNIVVLGVAHSNTSIVANMLVAAGWQRNDLDENGESVSVVAQNKLLMAGKLASMAETVRNLEEPWVVKDPAFQRTLNKWIAAFYAYQPLLIFLRKNHEAVMRSYLRRTRPEWGRAYPITLETIVNWDNLCKKQFELWPWKKTCLKAEKIGEACALFNPEKSGGKGDAVLEEYGTAFVSGNEFAIGAGYGLGN